MLREGKAMKTGHELAWSQVIMAANTPMLLKASMVDGRADLGLMTSGQVVGLIEDLPSVEELINRIVAQAGEVLERLTAPVPATPFEEDAALSSAKTTPSLKRHPAQRRRRQVPMGQRALPFRRIVPALIAVLSVLVFSAACVPAGTPVAPVKDAIPANGVAGDHGWFQAGHQWVGDFGDPDILRVGNTYYAYSSAAGGRYLSVLTSTDLKTLDDPPATGQPAAAPRSRTTPERIRTSTRATTTTRLSGRRRGACPCHTRSTPG